MIFNKIKSIKQFLILSLFAILTLSFLVMFLVNRYLAMIEIDELYDAQLAQTNRMLQGFVDRPLAEINFEHLNSAMQNAVQAYSGMEDDERSSDGHGYEGKLAIQIWDSQGHLRLKTPTAPAHALAPLQNGYFLTQHDAFDWYVFSRHLPNNGLWIILAERSDVRSELIDKISLSSFGGLIVAALLMGISLILVIARGLHPLLQLSAQLGERHIDKLEPVSLGHHQPKELKPLVQAINNLMARVAQDLERERRFLGDVAHELRTPLAALKLNTQLGLSSEDLPSCKHNLTKVLKGVDRSTRLMEQLLTLARLDLRALGSKELLNLGKLAQETVQALVEARPTKQLDHSIHIAPELFMQQLYAYPVLMGVMLRNLLENACHYSPAHSLVTIDCMRETPGVVVMSISDEGPGVATEQLESLCQRFFREHPADRQGSGLGLSIVARIVEIHGATLVIANRTPQGLQVTISFPETQNAS